VFNFNPICPLVGRRSDHTRPELEALILAEGHRLMAEAGYAGFSAREVAKRIGYSIGTIYNVFGSHDRLVMAINSRTFGLWAAWMRTRLDADPADRIAVLVESYFGFAAANPNLWMAIYDHRFPTGEELPERYRTQRAELTGIVEEEIIRVLPAARAGQAAAWPARWWRRSTGIARSRSAARSTCWAKRIRKARRWHACGNRWRQRRANFQSSPWRGRII
jgi:AcrR family transcriptional regulator